MIIANIFLRKDIRHIALACVTDGRIGSATPIPFGSSVS